MTCLTGIYYEPLTRGCVSDNDLDQFSSLLPFSSTSLTMNPLNNPPMFDSDQRRERDHGLEAMILSLQRSVGALTDTVTCMSYEHGRLQQEVARLQA